MLTIRQKYYIEGQIISGKYEVFIFYQCNSDVGLSVARNKERKE